MVAGLMVAGLMASTACGTSETVHENYVTLPSLAETERGDLEQGDVEASDSVVDQTTDRSNSVDNGDGSTDQVAGASATSAVATSTIDTATFTVEVTAERDAEQTRHGPNPTQAGLKALADLADLDQVGPEEFDELFNTYDLFLDLRPRVVTRTRESSAILDPVATPNAIAQVEALRTANDHLDEVHSRKADKQFEFPNVASIRIDGEDRRFIDCTEVQRTNLLTGHTIFWETNEVVMVPSADGYKVESVTSLQDGISHREKGDYGCLPGRLAERAENAAAEAITRLAVGYGDPAAAVAEGMSGPFDEDTRELLLGLMGELTRRGLHRPPSETVEIRAVGIHLHKPEFTAIVSVCRTWPAGRYYLDDYGNPTLEDLAPGESEQEWLFVLLDLPTHDGTNDVVTEAVFQGRGCDAPYVYF